jgi:hypothetical protein
MLLSERERERETARTKVVEDSGIRHRKGKQKFERRKTSLILYDG